MPWKISWLVLCIGLFGVLAQGILAYDDGYFTYGQMRKYQIFQGYSFLEHGGMWSDVFIVSPLVAHLTATYHFGYFRWYGMLILAISATIAILANQAYNSIGLYLPVPHNHDGHITAAGWVHVVFAIIVMWVVGMFYFSPISPNLSTKEIIAVTSALTIFFPLGIIDFTRRWKFIRAAKIQLTIQIIAVWIIALLRISL